MELFARLGRMQYWATMTCLSIQSEKLDAFKIKIRTKSFAGDVQEYIKHPRHEKCAHGR